MFKSLYTCTNVVTGTGVSAFLSPSSLPSQSVTIHVFFTREIFSFSLSVGINNVVELCLRVQDTGVVSVSVGLLGCV